MRHKLQASLWTRHFGKESQISGIPVQDPRKGLESRVGTQKIGETLKTPAIVFPSFCAKAECQKAICGRQDDVFKALCNPEVPLKVDVLEPTCRQ